MLLYKGVGKRGAGGAAAPPDFNSCHFTTKETTEEKKQLSSYKHAVLHTKIEAQI